MEMNKGKVYLANAFTMTPRLHWTKPSIEYRDLSGNNVIVPLQLVVNCYELAKYEYERTPKSKTWEEFIDELVN